MVNNYQDNFIQWIGIVSVISSPLIAVLVSLWIGEKMRKRSNLENRQSKILETLIESRFVPHSMEFLSALNSIVFAFRDSEKIINLTRELHRAYANKEDQAVIDQRLINLIYEICKYMSYDISDDDIRNVFIPNYDKLKNKHGK